MRTVPVVLTFLLCWSMGFCLDPEVDIKFENLDTLQFELERYDSDLFDLGLTESGIIHEMEERLTLSTIPLAEGDYPIVVLTIECNSDGYTAFYNVELELRERTTIDRIGAEVEVVTWRETTVGASGVRYADKKIRFAMNTLLNEFINYYLIAKYDS